MVLQEPGGRALADSKRVNCSKCGKEIPWETTAMWWPGEDMVGAHIYCEPNPGPLAQPPTTASTADPATNRPSVELGPPRAEDG